MSHREVNLRILSLPAEDIEGIRQAAIRLINAARTPSPEPSGEQT